MNELLSLLRDACIPLPVVELSLLILLLSVSLVFRLTRFGLITAYLFVYRWGLLFFLKQGSQLVAFYLVFGFAIGIATIIGLIWKPSPE